MQAMEISKETEIERFKEEVVAMGLSRKRADIALRRCDNDLDSAMGYILSAEDGYSDEESTSPFEHQQNSKWTCKVCACINQERDVNCSKCTAVPCIDEDGVKLKVDSDNLDLTQGLEPVVDCVVCMEELPISEIFTVDCESSHKFCLPCIRRHVTIALGEKKMASCIMCSHELTQAEIRQLFGNRSVELAKHLDAEIMNVMAAQPDLYIGCPTPDCMEYIEATTPGVPERCTCPRCDVSFCSQCKELYHGIPSGGKSSSGHAGALTCSEAAETFRRWNQWRSLDRAEFMKKVYGGSLSLSPLTTSPHPPPCLKKAAIQGKHDQKKIDAATKDALKRFKELQKDEGWKEKHCRICPHCGKTIHRVDGCTYMVCGRDSEDKGGGNRQDGCGKNFDWAKAKKYARGGDVAKLPKSITDVDPNAAGEVHHHLMGFVEADCLLRCEVCSEEIVGPRFSCIHCRGGLECCINCSHSFESLDHDPNEHAFQIFFEDAGVEAPPPLTLPPLCIDISESQEEIIHVSRKRSKQARRTTQRKRRTPRTTSASSPVVIVDVEDSVFNVSQGVGGVIEID